ncbi:DUF433 domain-containing protein [Candidatus Sumerlaeota bacterium]|nr:DUF433 domain-containing protein [Candidatus Sumerlaeota bacterium]
MSHQELLDQITADPEICGGKPCVRGTRIEVQVVLDSLAEGLTPEQIVDHFPSLTVDTIRACVAYAAELARESVWKVLSH